MEKDNAVSHLIWGISLSLMGIALIVRSPQVMGRIVQIEYYAPISWLIRLIVYLIALMLIGGGAKKIFDSSKKLRHRGSNRKNRINC